MPHRQKIWTREQLCKMNEENFLVELLDMLKFSPEISDSDSDVESMKSKLEAIEENIKGRLDSI
ncbi:hypothetical protein [Marinobacterium arenosum]|uniref:hypothetical protein n=1 Tax=Marinobacterium arenosum TaxID=2862496 RepID=UPI001C98DAA8|nr:hypothetical protein [Marinobacterium arenosum]MBY4678009.1 hypothetical protein [Marinobacterium arenosum]